jgi:hypothetical protein
MGALQHAGEKPLPYLIMGNHGRCVSSAGGNESLRDLVDQTGLVTNPELTTSYSFRRFAVTTAMQRRLDHESLLRLGSWHEKIGAGSERAPAGMPARYTGEKLIDQAIEKHAQLFAMQLAFKGADMSWMGLRLQPVKPLNSDTWEERIKMASGPAVWTVPSAWLPNNHSTGFKLKQVARDRLLTSRQAGLAVSPSGAIASGDVRLVPKAAAALPMALPPPSAAVQPPVRAVVRLNVWRGLLHPLAKFTLP